MSDNGFSSRPSPSRLYRDPGRALLLGVCAGLADYLGIAPVVVRALALVGLFMFTVPTLLAYLVLGLALPRKPQDLYASPKEEDFWRGVRTEPGRTARDLEHAFERIERRLRNMEACVTSESFKLNRAFRDLER